MRRELKQIEFPPLTEADLPLVEGWLRREHVARWWRDDIGESLAEYRRALEGREPTDHFLIEVDRRPVGMIQTYLISDYPEWEEVVQVGDGVAGVDLMIGEADIIGHGLGPRVLAQFAREVVLARPGTQAVVATVDEANRRSWRAFEKAGFRYARDVVEEGRPHRLMRLDGADGSAR
jgi:RimJ/RimL family protein N-acetyltransferase